jgi:hypothetical protein
MNDPLPALRRRLALRHHLIGWWALFVFVTLGFGLEILHGIKADFYLDPPHRLRRLLWTLAHAHGTLLGVVHIGFAIGLMRFGRWTERSLKLASFFLTDALLLLPTGFFLGGIGHTEVDPSSGVLLVPVGALFMMAAVGMIAWAALGTPPDEGDKTV